MSKASDPLQGLTLAKPTIVKQEKQQPLFRKELPQIKIDIEFHRKMAFECSKRCMMHRKPKVGEIGYVENDVDELNPKYDRVSISHGEQLCLNRCIAKIMQVKEVVDRKIGNYLEMPPILFNQNLP